MAGTAVGIFLLRWKNSLSLVQGSHCLGYVPGAGSVNFLSSKILLLGSGNLFYFLLGNKGNPFRIKGRVGVHNDCFFQGYVTVDLGNQKLEHGI